MIPPPCSGPLSLALTRDATPFLPAHAPRHGICCFPPNSRANIFSRFLASSCCSANIAQAEDGTFILSPFAVVGRLSPFLPGSGNAAYSAVTIALRDVQGCVSISRGTPTAPPDFIGLGCHCRPDSPASAPGSIPTSKVDRGQ